MQIPDENITYNLEYRSRNDEAWYTCAVLLEHSGTHLRVKFKDFVQSYHDEVFSASDFSNNDDIGRFVRRFRLESEPVEDNECSKVTEGFTVCAAYTRDEQLRYFDAVVDAVCYKEHTPEKCLCTFLLFWQHGPEEGNTTAAKLDDIYLHKHGPVDPAVIKFAELMKEKVQKTSFEFTLIPKNPLLSRKASSNETITISRASFSDFGSTGHSSHVTSLAGRERFCPELSDQDQDLGGVKERDSHHFLLLENLEKDLCPSLMMDFIHEQTLVNAQAFVFPSSLAETYARGAILVDSRSKLKRIYEFINNPNQFIISSSGRPWVITEDKLRSGTFNMNLHSFKPKYENYSPKTDLKVVRLGTKEYAEAKRLKDLYLEFRDHLNVLVQRLEREEKKSREPFNGN